MVRVGIGQDSHSFVKWPFSRPLTLGGIQIGGTEALDGNSDADVVLHALCNAISGVTCVNILGAVADHMCRNEGITDSAAYVREAMKHLGNRKITHISFTIECARPAISPHIDAMRAKIAGLAGIPPDSVGITATSGEGLTAFGRGDGIQVFCAVTTCDETKDA